MRLANGLRRAAIRFDAADPLAGYRERVIVTDPDLLYLDGNSLGRCPVTTPDRLAAAVREEWATGLVRSWSNWVELPRRVGDLIGTAILGARPGEVLVADSTTVNLYKLAAAALSARPGRSTIVTDDDNFPTDRYVLAGLARDRGGRLRVVPSDVDRGPDPAAIAAALDADVALLSLSHVAYRSGALADLPALTRAAHDAGALVLWDLSHSAGSVPVDLDASGADLAVGCTYKYLCGGPGAPAYLYVRGELQERLGTPIQGWFGQRGQFAMGSGYQPAPGIDRFAAGTPPVLGIYGVAEGAALVAEAGVPRLAAKGAALSTYLMMVAEEWLAALGFRLASPRNAAARGSHVTLHHPDAWPIAQALADRGVIADYRTPDRLRLGPAPLYTRFVDVHDALERLRDLVTAGEHGGYPREPARVT